jgi:hypothetical protein
MTEPFDWKPVIEEATIEGKFDIMTSDDPEKESEHVLVVAKALQAYITLLDDAGYSELPGWQTLEFLSAVVISLYKAVDVDVEM